MPEKLNYFYYLTKREERNIRRTRRYFSKELKFWKECFNLLYDAFKVVTNSHSEKWSDSKTASFFILPRLIMSSKTSLELLIRGYYFDFIVIERSLLESIALFTFLSKNEEAAKKWLAHEELELPKWKLMHQFFPSPTREILKKATKLYAEQSEFVHSSFIAVASELKRHLSRKEYLEIPKFQKLLICDQLSTPICLLILLCLIEAFREELKDFSKTKVKNLVTPMISDWNVRRTL